MLPSLGGSFQLSQPYGKPIRFSLIVPLNWTSKITGSKTRNFIEYIFSLWGVGGYYILPEFLKNLTKGIVYIRARGVCVSLGVSFLKNTYAKPSVYAASQTFPACRLACRPRVVFKNSKTGNPVFIRLTRLFLHVAWFGKLDFYTLLCIS